MEDSFSFVSIVSTLYATAVLANNLIGFEFIKNACETNWPLVLVVCVIAALVVNREQTLTVGTIAGTCMQTKTRVNNLFTARAYSFVIPTNIYFCTKVDGKGEV